MTENPLHAVSLATDSGFDSKSLTHHAKNAEDILSKIPHELQKLIQLHLSPGGSDRVREETNLRKRINEHLDYVISLFGHIQEEKDAREMELKKVRDEFRGIIQRFERLSHYCLAKLPTVVQKECSAGKPREDLNGSGLLSVPEFTKEEFTVLSQHDTAH